MQNRELEKQNDELRQQLQSKLKREKLRKEKANEFDVETELKLHI